MAKKKTNLSRVIPRLLSYIILRHKLIFGIVVICILISSCTVVASSLFLEILIDNYIEPLLLENTPVFSGLLHTVLFMAVVYIIGVFSTLAYNRLMVKISQGTLKQIRDDMFSHMQELPIGYFDTHTHGDTIMQLGNLQYVLIALVGGYMAISGIGSVTVGMIVAFLNLSKTFCIPISQISQQISLMAMAFAGAERIFDLINEEPEQDNGYVTLTKIRYNNGLVEETNDTTGIWAWKHPHHDGTLTYTELHGEIEFFDVDFGYTKEKLVLHNIALNATSGQKIAFVGATGAGKTTITNLINRFYDLVDGKIRYDGININKIRKSDLRRSLGVVLQDVNLFTGTIMDNIRYGNLNATDEECIKASKLSNADKFIRHLPEGYQTMLTQNGASLSQGQRQLLSIARATVANPPVMILDEATSSIDTRTEALVQQGMDNLMKGRTTFVIAHRLSTVRNSDTIIVLDLGRIIERGTHNELIQKHGVYYSLYTGAFELE